MSRNPGRLRLRPSDIVFLITGICCIAVLIYITIPTKEPEPPVIETFVPVVVIEEAKPILEPELVETLEIDTEIILEPEPINLGEFRITVYTPYCDGGIWGYQTATGVRSEHLTTCAVDPKVIALGSTLEIDGLTLCAVDTGSAVKGNKIDIFFDGSISEAYKWIQEFGDIHDVSLIEQETDS